MKHIQLRIKPKRSLLDIDIPLLRERLATLQGVAEINIFDDRASDATFITVILTLTGLDTESVSRLKKELLHIPKIIPFLVNKQGKEVLVSSMSEEEIIRFAD